MLFYVKMHGWEAVSEVPLQLHFFQQTPAQKIKGHFSTGHADSPMTIVVGRAHARAVKPAGQVPKLVRNLALMKRSMEMNESFTGKLMDFKYRQFGGGQVVVELEKVTFD